MKRQTDLFSVLKFGAFAFLLMAGGAVSPAFAAPPKAAPEKSEAEKLEEASYKTSAETTLRSVIQDAYGDLWGVPQLDGVSEKWPIARWDGSHWRLQKIPQGTTGRCMSLLAESDGSILTQWEGREVVEYRGGIPRLLTRLPYVSDWNWFRAAYVGGPELWALNSAADVFRIDRKAAPENALQQVYKSNPDDFFPGALLSPEKDRRPEYAGLSLLKDTLGRTWFWANAGGQERDYATLRGFLLWDGAKMRRLPEIKGIPTLRRNDPMPPNGFNPRFDCVAQRDADHLWIAVQNVGLFIMDIHTFAAALVPEPEKGAFRFIQKIQALGGDWGVIAGTKQLQSAMENRNELSGNAWLLHNGAWKKVVTGLSRWYGSQNASMAATPEGIWIAAPNNGLWLVPADGKPPREIDWRSGYDNRGIFELYTLPPRSGGLVAWSMGLRLNMERFASIAPDNTLVTLQTQHELIQDDNGAIWNITAKPGAAKTAGTLDKWDGVKWESVPLPPEANTPNLFKTGIDALNRLWFETWLPVPGQPDYRVFVYNSISKTWLKYPTWDKALEANAAALETAKKRTVSSFSDYYWRFSRMAGSRPQWNVTDFSGEKICYTADGFINYFDGAKWHRYTRSKINSGDEDFSFDEPAFFDKQGTLCINLNGREQDPAKRKTWRLFEGDAWVSGPHQQGPYETIYDNAPEVNPPAELVNLNYSSCARDRTGAFWLTANGMLYRAVPGQSSKPQFSPDAVTPFRVGHRIGQALIDQRGNAFVSSSAGYLFIPVRP